MVSAFWAQVQAAGFPLRPNSKHLVEARWAEIGLSQDWIRNAGPAYIRKAAMRPDNREVKHVPAYSHSDRWVGASAAWGGAWIGVGEIRWSQGICNLRCGTASCADRRFCERVGSRGKCGQGGRCFLRDNS